MSIWMHRWAGFALGVLGALGATMPAHAQDSAPLHIGVLAPLSGPFERLGRQIEAGVALALAEAGLDDSAVRITAVDDACDEERGRDSANQLVGAQVDIVVGGVCWRPAVAARNVLAFSGTPFIAAGVRHGAFTDDADGPVLRLGGRDDEQSGYLGDAILQGALDDLIGGSGSSRPIVVFYTDGNYGRTLAEGLEARLKAAGAAPALMEAFDASADLTAYAQRAEAEGADLAVILAGQADSAVLADALRTRLPDVAILAGDTAMTAEFRLLADGSAQDVVFARPTPWRALVAPDRLAALEEEPAALAGLVLPAMAATQIALAYTPDEAQTYETIIGPIQFDANGDSDVPSFQLWQWRDGLMWPFEGGEASEG